MTAVVTAALVHFIWQGLLVFLLLRAALFFLRDCSANARYATNCAALAILAVAPAITAAILYHPATVILSPAAGTTAVAVTAASSIHESSWTAALRPWILPVWALGVALCSLRMLWACAQVASLRRRSVPAAAAIEETVARMSERLGVTRRARVLISTCTGGPCVVGWLRPALLLPAAALAGLSPEQLEAILAHELAHIRRHDYLVNWLQIAIETLLFYHPAVWWISARIREERELCCDDLAVRACAGPVCYARALTVLERLRSGMPVTALGGTGGPLLYRIQRIVGADASPYGPSRASGVAAVVVALVFVGATLHWSRAQSQPRQDYLVMGDTLLRAGSNELALEKYRDGMAHHLEDRATYQKRVIETLLRMNREADAYAVNDDLLRSRPDDTGALTLRAAGLVDRGDTAEAIRILEAVLARVPENPVAHLNLGLAYAAQKQLGHARQEIDEALRLRPDFTRARTALATIEAAPPPQQAQALPQDRATLSERALALRQAGRDAESDELLAQIATNERNQAELTLSFLRDELQQAQARLSEAGEQTTPEARQQRAKAEAELYRIRHRLVTAENTAMVRLQLELREKKLEEAKAAGDREAARKLEAQVQHLKAGRESQAANLRAMLQELELRLATYGADGKSREVQATRLQIESLRGQLERLLEDK